MAALPPLRRRVIGMLARNPDVFDRMLAVNAGQVPLRSIGVSGAPGGDKDAVCAQAGIDRIAKGLAG